MLTQDLRGGGFAKDRRDEGYNGGGYEGEEGW